jgi:hypothetical protein
MSTLLIHTHLRATQAETHSKVCKGVCLPYAEKKKLKISFPSKNFKNTNPHSDTKTFGQLVAELNTYNGCELRSPRTPVCNTGLAKVAVQCSASTFVVKIATFDKLKPEKASFGWSFLMGLCHR